MISARAEAGDRKEKRCLKVLSSTGPGHACKLEEADLFNAACERFFHQVESGQYRLRDPRAAGTRML